MHLSPQERVGTSHQKRSGEAGRWNGAEIWSCYRWVFPRSLSDPKATMEAGETTSEPAKSLTLTIPVFSICSSFCVCAASFSPGKAFQHLVFFSYQNFQGEDHLLSCSENMALAFFSPVFQTGLSSVELALVKNLNFLFFCWRQCEIKDSFYGQDMWPPYPSLKSAASGGYFQTDLRDVWCVSNRESVGSQAGPLDLAADNGGTESKGVPPRLNPAAFILKRHSNFLNSLTGELVWGTMYSTIFHLEDGQFYKIKRVSFAVSKVILSMIQSVISFRRYWVVAICQASHKALENKRWKAQFSGSFS